jgi:hypothetical protein
MDENTEALLYFSIKYVSMGFEENDESHYDFRAKDKAITGEIITESSFLG